MKGVLIKLVIDINMSTKRRYREIDYDYENFYDTPIDSLKDKYIDELLRTNKIDHHYTTKTIRSGNQFEVEIYPTFNKKDIENYKPPRKPSKKAQKNLNEKNSRKRLIRLINANFDLDDWAIHLTYSNENLPPTVEEGEKEVRNYIRRINYRRKKAGLPNAKWIYVTEHDPAKKIRMHHHLLIEKGIDRKVMKNLWKNGTRTEVEELEPDEFGLTGIANYISKDPKGKKRWKSSKNLKQPVERKSYTVFSKKKISKMISDTSLISQFMNSNYKSKQYLSHEVRYNKTNHMYYIYVQMRVKNKDERERRNI